MIPIIRPHNEIENEALRLANSGLGVEDLVVRLNLTMEHAARIVWSQQLKAKFKIIEKDIK